MLDEIPIESLKLQVQPGKHQVEVDCSFTDDEGAELKVGFRVFSKGQVIKKQGRENS